MYDEEPETDVPSYYELSYRDNGFVVELHPRIAGLVVKDAARFAENGFPVSATTFTFKEFLTPSENSVWGYGPVASVTRSRFDPNWMAIRFILPEGRMGLWACAATLSVVLQALYLAEVNDMVTTDSDNPQLLTVQTMTDISRVYGGSIEAVVHPSLCRWIAEHQTPETAHEISQAMLKFYSKNAFKKESDDPDFSYRPRPEDFPVKFHKPKWIHLDCWGNACGLDPGHDAWNSPSVDIGYKLLPHNTDTASQQLTLLVGLCKLVELARQ